MNTFIKQHAAQRRLFIAGFLMVFSFITSCDVQKAVNKTDSQRIALSTDAQTLSKRVDVVNQPIGSSKATTISNTDFTYLADVRTPTANGRKLSATSTFIMGDYAYVSYQLHGKDYGGAVDIIDISDGNNPRIVSNMTVDDTDFNDITVDESGTHAYVAGGRKVSSSGYTKDGHNGAIVAEIEIKDDSVLTDNMRETPLKSYSGNAVEVSDDYIGVTTGGTGGGIYAIDRQNFSVVDGIDRDLARYVDIEGNTIVGMALNVDPQHTTKIYRFEAQSNTIDSLDTQLTLSTEDGKNVIDLHNGKVYAALSKKGFKEYDFSNGSSPVGSFALQSNGLANGLDVSDNYLYMAAGSEGLYIADLPNLNEVFHWDSEKGSANFVEADNGYIFVAKGTDGLNILKGKNNSSTQPTACPFDGSDGTVVEFKGNRLLANSSQDKAETDITDVNLTAGTYTVKLYGYDDHRNDGYDRTQQNQPNESFFVSLMKDGSDVAQTGALGDLPDDSNLGTKTTVIDDFELKSDVNKAKGIHAAYPDNSSANSLNAKCVAFKKK